MHRIAVLASLLAWLSPPMAEGSFALQPNVTQERYQVVLLTIDQGDDLWERFGHNAILIRDRSTGQDLAWNWGLYNFEDADFLPRFLRGTMRYTMGPALLEPFLARHRETNRTVYANEILVTQAEAGELDELVRRNFEPGNREYVYHYFLDNCSTRARDILDVALGGILSERFSEAITPMSYRWHTRRLVQQTAWIDQGLSFLLGTRGDPPRTQWDAMFIPMEMMRILEDFGRSDGLGGTTPLLGPRQVLVQATRSVAPEAPPSFRFIWLGLGLGSAALFLTLGSSAGRGSRTAKLALAGTVGVWGLVFWAARCVVARRLVYRPRFHPVERQHLPAESVGAPTNGDRSFGSHPGNLGVRRIRSGRYEAGGLDRRPIRFRRFASALDDYSAGKRGGSCGGCSDECGRRGGASHGHAFSEGLTDQSLVDCTSPKGLDTTAAFTPPTPMESFPVTPAGRSHPES